MVMLLLIVLELIYLFTWGFNDLYSSYYDTYLCGQRKPVHTVGQGSVL